MHELLSKIGINDVEYWLSILYRYIVPSIVILIALIFALLLVWKNNSPKELHRLQSREFVVRTLMCMLFVCGSSMAILMLGGLDFVIEAHSSILAKGIRPTNVALPIITKILITFIGLLLTFLLIRPRLSIHPLSVYEKNERTTWLTFQVWNLSLWESINMKAELFEYHFEDRGGKLNKVMKSLPLEPLANTSIIGWRLGYENESTYLVETKAGVFHKNKFINSNKRLELRVAVTHPISRITRVFVRDYSVEDIHYGEFQGHDLLRFSEDNRSAYNDVLKKETLWRSARFWKTTEVILTVILLILICVCIVKQPGAHCSWYQLATYGFYALSVLVATAEIARQWKGRPVVCSKENSSLKR